MMEDLKAAGMEHLYETIEMPLVFTLADMEHTGIAIDAANLKEYGGETCSPDCRVGNPDL